MYMLRFVKYLKCNSDYEFHILCKSGEFGALEDDFRKANVRLIPMKQGYFNLADFLRIKQLMEREHYEAICDFTGNFAGIPMLVAKLAGCHSRLCFFRSSNVSFKPTLLRRVYCRLVNRLTYQNATTVLSNSREAFENFFPEDDWLQDSRFEVVPNGISWRASVLEDLHRKRLQAEFDLSLETKVIGHVGRFAGAKNHFAILDVAEQMLEIDRNIVFLLIGRDVREHLEGPAKSRKLNNVRFAEERRDVLDLFWIMDAFYFPSLWEGQPNAVLEAIASEVPFVISDIQPVKECFPDWWGDQWLVPPTDTKAACKLLLSHLSGEARICEKFQKLVAWIRQNNSPQLRFEQFLSHLEFSGSNTGKNGLRELNQG